MSETPDAVAQAREDMVQSAFVDDSLGLVVIPAHKIDALIAAVRAECADRVRGEQMVDDLANVVDDVNPRKTHTEDIEDARIYCEFIAKRIREAP